MKMSLAKKIYLLIRGKGELTTNQVIDLVETAYKNEYNNTEEWCIRVTQYFENSKKSDEDKQIFIDALWEIVKFKYATTEIKEQQRQYTWTTYGKYSKGKKIDNFTVKVRVWKTIK